MQRCIAENCWEYNRKFLLLVKYHYKQVCIPVGCLSTNCLLVGGAYFRLGCILPLGGIHLQPRWILPFPRCTPKMHPLLDALPGCNLWMKPRWMHPSGCNPLVNRMTHACENITFPYFVCGGTYCN